MWIRLEIRDPGVVHGERAVEGYSVGTVECYIGTWRRWRMLVEFGISCSSLEIFLYVLFLDLRNLIWALIWRVGFFLYFLLVRI